MANNSNKNLCPTCKSELMHYGNSMVCLGCGFSKDSPRNHTHSNKPQKKNQSQNTSPAKDDSLFVGSSVDGFAFDEKAMDNQNASSTDSEDLALLYQEPVNMTGSGAATNNASAPGRIPAHKHSDILNEAAWDDPAIKAEKTASALPIIIGIIIAAVIILIAIFGGEASNDFSQYNTDTQLENAETENIDDIMLYSFP